MGESLTVAGAVRRGLQELGARSETPNLDVQLLLMKATSQTRAWVLAHPEAELSAVQSEEFQADLQQLASGTALPYILGWWEFYGRRFRLTPDALIPRPETELLVEHGLRWLHQSGAGRALDLGTGSGVVAITLALERSELQVTASDIDLHSLRLAQANARWYGVGDRIRFVRADLLAPFHMTFDLICANLPYIPSDELGSLAVAQREPLRALDGGQGGTSLIRRTLAALSNTLAPGGLALFEMQPDQAAELPQAACESLPDAQVQVERDLAGRHRLLLIQRSGSSAHAD